MDEVNEIKERYKRRYNSVREDKYTLTNPHILMLAQERERKLVRLLKKAGLLPLKDKKILEIGCGIGSNLLDFIRYGAIPGNILGNDLLENRIAVTRERLPGGVRLICGEASELEVDDDSFDITMQFTVFTSILDDRLQNKIAEKMWRATKPGGYIIWYDFVLPNPRNPDVRAVPLKRVKKLFPQGIFMSKKTTLLPPIAEWVTKRAYFPYGLANAFPFLRMHVLCLIKKPK